MVKRKITKQKKQKKLQSVVQNVTVNLPSRGKRSTQKQSSQPQYQQPILMAQPNIIQPSGFSQSQIRDILSPFAYVRPLDKPSPILYEPEYNLPTAEVYRLPPELDPIPLDPLIIKQNTGKYNPYKSEIFSSSDKFQGEAFQEPLRNFQENISRNELLNDYSEPSTPSEDIRDSYNLNLNSFQNELDEIPPATEEVMSSPYDGGVKKKKGGRIPSDLTQNELQILRKYVRASLTKAQFRTLEQQQDYANGMRIRNNKRNNPYITPTIQSLWEEYYNEGK